jgi:hypothetical protein
MDMLYSKKFFDSESEAYKQNLYESEKTEIESKINRLIAKIKGKQSIAISEAEASELKAIVNRFVNYSRYGYDPKNTASYAQQALVFSAIIDEVAKPLTRTYIEDRYSAIESAIMSALDRYHLKVNLDKAKEDQRAILNVMKKVNDMYQQNAFGEEEVFMKIYEFLSEKEGKIIQTANGDIEKYNNHITDLRSKIDTKNAIRKTMCPKCEIDYAKSTAYKEGDFFTLEKPGKIVMKTGDVTEFYKSGKIWTLRDGFLGIGETTFKSYSEMLDHFLKKCKEKYFCD